VALDRLGYRVTGLDIRHDAEVLEHWSTARRHHPTVRFVSGDARHLPLTGPFDAALLLYNSLALFHTNEAAIALWSDVRRILAPTGVLIIDNICRSLWTEIAAGRYADGISEDGLWQMTWLPGRNVFSLRYGHQVRPDHPRPRRGETLYRAWSLDELDLLCRLTGWQLEPASLRRSLLVARPTNDQATR
jgi:SAM-dependent methyltransferase